MRAQFDGKLRLRSTPCAFCRVPRAQPSGFTLVTATISVPRGAPALDQLLDDRDACGLVAVDAADDEHAVGRDSARPVRPAGSRGRRRCGRPGAPREAARAGVSPVWPHLGGLSAANGSVIASSRRRKRKSSAGRPPARPGLAALARRLEHAAAEEHALEVRRRDVVAERRRVERRAARESVNVAGASAKPMFVYESFPRRRSRPASTIAPWSNAVGGKAVDRVPARVGGHGGIDAERDEAEVGGRELPLDRVRARGR